ncbi:MAG: TolC family protein [Candidatus Zixiibacteriota bacterium]|nr:MAG: TolC family protein [candidate division Zixibacteria bacterium]
MMRKTGKTYSFDTPGGLMQSTRYFLMLLMPLVFSLFSAQAQTQREKHVADSLQATYETSATRAIVIDSNATLDDYLAYAALNNPGLKAAFYRWTAALSKSGYAGALPDPMLSYGYFIENVETRVGPQNQRIGIKQAFPWFGTLGAKKDIALEQARSAYEQYESLKLRLFYQVKAAYNDYYYLGRDIQLTKDNLELLTFWESVVRTKYRVGLKRHPDLMKVQVELGKLEDKLLTLQDKIAPTAARLRAAVNLPDSVTLPVPTQITVNEVELQTDSVVAATLANNPDLLGLQHQIAREEAGVRLAGKASLPNSTLGVDYIETGPAVNPSLEGSGKDPWIVGVGINLPIWFGKNSAKKHEARARLRAMQYHFADTRNRLAAFVERVAFEYSDALRKLRLYRDGLVPKAEQSLNANYAAYQAGELDFLNVLDAQRQLLDFQLRLERARADLATRQAELEYLTGNETQR